MPLKFHFSLTSSEIVWIFPDLKEFFFFDDGDQDTDEDDMEEQDFRK